MIEICIQHTGYEATILT